MAKRSSWTLQCLLGCITALFEVTLSTQPYFDPISINCGGPALNDSQGESWVADIGFLAGEVLNIANPNLYSLSDPEASLRYFRRKEVSCYNIPLPSGRFIIRPGFAYRNVDSLNAPPKFSFYVEGIRVGYVRLGDWETANNGAYNIEYVVLITDGMANICLLPDVGNPVINTLQIYPQKSDFGYSTLLSYPSSFLVAHYRLNCAGKELGPRADTGFRMWSADPNKDKEWFKGIASNSSIQGVNEPPDYLPEAIFQSAREAGQSKFIGYWYYFKGLSNLNQWFIRLYFAELNPDVKLGERVFDIKVNTITVERFDILVPTNNKPFTPTVVSLLFNLTLLSYTSPANVIIGLSDNRGGSIYNPIISALEIFEVIPSGVAREDVEAELGERGGGPAGLSAGSVAAIAIGAVGGALALGSLSAFLLMWRRQTRHGGGMEGSPMNSPIHGGGGDIFHMESVERNSELSTESESHRPLFASSGESSSAVPQRWRPRLEGLPSL